MIQKTIAVNVAVHLTDQELINEILSRDPLSQAAIIRLLLESDNHSWLKDLTQYMIKAGTISSILDLAASARGFAELIEDVYSLLLCDEEK